MKTYLSALFLLLTLSFFSQEETILNGKDAFEYFKNAKQIKVSTQSKIPTYIKFIEEKQPSVTEFIDELKKRTKNNFELINTSSLTDELGFMHLRYQQTINNKPLPYTCYILHIKNNKVVAANGELVTNSVNTATPGLSFSTALSIAKGHVGAKKYRWENKQEELFLKQTQNNPNATYFPENKLGYISKDNNPANQLKLAYKLNIYASEPLSRYDIYVDAVNGEILFKNNLIHHGNVTGTAQTAYSGTQTITTDSYSGGYRLKETGRGNGIETYDLNQDIDFYNAIDFTDSDNNWNNINPQLDQYATDAHWGAETVYDYYFQNHNRNSIDNMGFTLISYVHYDSGFVNAFWDGTAMTYGDGYDTVTPLTSLEITGHEITHGVVEYTAGLIYSYESGALNESFADIFGTTIDFWKRPYQANWIIGDEIGSPFRSMANPNDYQCPDTYNGIHWEYTSYDNGGVHINSGVQNFWYYLLVNGGNGVNDNNDTYNVPGIGMTKAAKIAYRNLSVYLTPNSQFNDARFFSIKAAEDLYGLCSSPEVIATTKAWFAVGVGSDYMQGGVSGDFIADQTSGCTAPLTVNFSNLSGGNGSYFWEFGDGATSTAANPTHTYNSTGTFTVKLQTNGPCGSATEIKTNYIDIDPTNECPLILPANGVAPIQKACTGSIYDDGGASGNYGDNIYSQVTIQPTMATQVILNFINFNTEATYDYLYVYDGNSVNSPLIGAYENDNPPPTYLYSSGNAITIKFISDNYVNLSGFQINWSCNNTVDIDEKNKGNEISLFPNPALNLLNIKIKLANKNYLDLKIIDLLGKIHYQYQSTEKTTNYQTPINIANLARGTYLLTVNGVTQKFIKQ